MAEGDISQRARVENEGAALVRVWDLPTRLFHWLLVLLVLAAVISAKIGGNAMVWHQRFGYAVFALLLFRILWGFVGGRWSRFASFIYSPAACWRYLRGRPWPTDRFEVGHSPTGAASVFLMLGWLAVQVGSGLVADDEIATTGPLNAWVDMEVGLAWTSWHRAWGQWGLIALVLLHVVAIAVYRHVKRRDLLGPMVHGDKPLPPDVLPSADAWPQRLLALALLVACVVGVLWFVNLPMALQSPA